MPLLEALEREWSRPANERSPSRLEMQDQDQDLDQEPTQEDKEIIVDWDGKDDPTYPMNWPVSQKWLITITMGIMTFFITFASSIFSAATQDVADKYRVSSVVATLGTSLFVLGFAFGPLIWGPASELYGRKIPLFTGIFIFAIFQIPVGVAGNLQTIMICRFFGGVFGSAPLAIVGGALSDLWEPVSRSVAMCVFAASTFIGPILAPIVGQFLTASYLGWRWTAWIVAIGSGASWLIAIFIIPETYAPVLLQRRAARLRIEKNNPAIHVLNEKKSINLSYIVRIYLLRPFIMAAREPILDLMTVYMALIYGILYLFFEVYPVSFQEQRKWKAGVGALPFLAVFVGVLLGVIAVAVNSKTRFARKMRENGGKVVPEERLPMMIVGAALFPAGLFWFAWTSNPHFSWKPQVVSGIPIGMGIMMIFLQGLNYIVDVYVFNSNSAIAANSFLRALAGAGFPLFAVAMYHNLGVDWATSLLAFLAVAMFPIPILFFIYGSRIRKLSRYSPPM